MLGARHDHRSSRSGERDRRIAELEKRVAELEELVGQLRELLRRSSLNSSKPPSTDPPSRKPKHVKAKSGRGPGGQPGHPKRERALVSSEYVDEFVTVLAPSCQRCAGPLQDWGVTPHVHQRFEIPRA